MDAQELQKLLESVAEGSLSVGKAQEKLTKLPYSDLGYARVDHHRALRQGTPEVVFGENKSVEQLDGIIGALSDFSQNVLVTRVSPEKAEKVLALHPDLFHHRSAHTLSRVVQRPQSPFLAPVALVTAGTSDQSVAEEAAETLRVNGVDVERFYDVGVAGVHRLLSVLPAIEAAPVVICIAGMEGALPSVLGGLIQAPIVAVPTSVGYGAALAGFTALMGMLTGCASGVTVVNIDNGFGAAMAVLRLGRALRSQAPRGDS